MAGIKEGKGREEKEREGEGSGQGEEGKRRKVVGVLDNKGKGGEAQKVSGI